MISSRKKSSRIIYHFSISHNNATFILWRLKNKASGSFFLSCCYEKFVKYFQTELLYLKVISNIVSGNTYWERRTKMWSNYVQTTHSTKVRPKDVPKRDKYFCIWSQHQLRLYYENGLHSTAGWRYKGKEYELHVLNWITRRIMYFFHQIFYQVLFFVLSAN